MFFPNVLLLYLFFEPNHNKSIIPSVYLCTFLLFRYILGSKTLTRQKKDERKEIFEYELVIIFFIIYLLYILVILMLIYVYAEVAPIRYGKRNKEPTSGIALREKNKMKRGENKRCVLYHNRPDKERAKEN
jgi:hypothetical protein